MPVFSGFWKILNKNKLGFLIYFVIFMGLALAFSKFIYGAEADTNFQTASMDIAIIDRDNSTLSKALTSHLEDAHNLVDLEDNTEAMQNAMFFRDVGYILIIPEGFGDSFAADNADAKLENIKVPDSTSGVFIDNQIDTYLITLRTYLNAGFNLENGLEKTAQDLANEVTVEISVDETVETIASSFYFQFLPYVFIMMIVLALGPIFLAFDRKDLARRIECSSLSLKKRNFQLTLGCITSSLAIWAVFMIVAYILYNEEMLTTIGTFRVINSLAFLIVSVAIAFLIGQLVKGNNVLYAASNVIGLGMSMLSGIFVPLELLSDNVLAFARFMPSYWYIRSNNMLSNVSVVSDDSLQIFLEGMGIQLGFAIAIFAIALVIVRQKKFKPAV